MTQLLDGFIPGKYLCAKCSHRVLVFLVQDGNLNDREAERPVACADCEEPVAAYRFQHAACTGETP